MTGHPLMTAGRPGPLGATLDRDGVNFAVFSDNATRMTLCLFDPSGNEHLIIDLPECDGGIWHGHMAGIRVGQHYGYRAHGPYRPDEGHRFNPHKLLMDPYAKRISGHPEWHDSLFGYDVSAKHGDLTFDTRNSGRYMSRAIVTDPTFPWGEDRPPAHPMSQTIFYEAHVKGLTMGRSDVPQAGTFAGLASDPMLDHLTSLGVTAIELLPVHAFLNDRWLLDKGLTNYWGYMTYGFFAPDPRYLPDGDLAAFQHMVKRLHAAGIEVILDVVYNHTAEGSQLGPTISFRGLDNRSYYRLAETPRYYINDTGTGNTLNMDHPMVVRMVMDSLRYWVEVMHVDGFRFDLASTLGRRAHGFDRDAPFFHAIRQDPVLSRVKLIAEPWDIGPGGYQLGNFPPPFAEWNDKFRDQTRKLWRGDRGMMRKLAIRLAGSALRFDHHKRPATTSVNFLTAHDGFTLMDLVSYNAPRNLANGEDGRDGHNNNHSAAIGPEGPATNKATRDARALRRRNMLTTLMLSQGTPLILAGDELGNSQGGNNNTFGQDNPTGWVDWDNVDQGFLAFCRKIIAFRKEHPILRQTRFLHSRNRASDGIEDLFWRRPDGQPMTESDWTNPDLPHLAVEMRTASGTPEYATLEYALFAVFNTGGAITVTLPETTDGRHWVCQIDTAKPAAPDRLVKDGILNANHAGEAPR
jgi:isoamylase